MNQTQTLSDRPDRPFRSSDTVTTTSLESLGIQVPLSKGIHQIFLNCFGSWNPSGISPTLPRYSLAPLPLTPSELLSRQDPHPLHTLDQEDDSDGRNRTSLVQIRTGDSESLSSSREQSVRRGKKDTEDEE
jgi:hypothetical protein